MWVSVVVAGCGAPSGEVDSGSMLDAGGFDAGVVDAGHDAGPSDAGLRDAGDVDAGLDAGTADAGTPDAGTTDAGIPDAGQDAGVDAGFSDAGQPDASVGDGGHGPLTEGATLSIHTTMGVPDTAAFSDPRKWLVVKPQYVVSFDTVTKTPNWVSWQYSLAWSGDAGRVGTWNPDPEIPPTLQAKDTNYVNSGYARGHMCPSDDRTLTFVDNDSTFVFTNAVPQLQQLNNGTWKQLEAETHQLTADAGTVLYVIAGPLREWVGYIDGGVLIPSATWKVVVVLSNPSDTAASVTASTRVISVIMPNDGGTTGKWTNFRVSVDEIEARTGLDLLSDVDTTVQAIIEARVDDAGAL